MNSRLEFIYNNTFWLRALIGEPTSSSISHFSWHYHDIRIVALTRALPSERGGYHLEYGATYIEGESEQFVWGDPSIDLRRKICSILASRGSQAAQKEMEILDLILSSN